MITSISNQRIKEIVQLQKKNRARNTEGVFIVEGIRMVREIPEDKLKALYVTEEFYKKHKAELPGNVKPEFVTPTVFSYIADTKTPQGVLAIVWQYKYTLADILKKGTEKKEMLLVLDNLQDPGNLGTIFRTAEAAGVTGIILSKDSVDIYNPKVIRSTMGAIFRMPFVYVEKLAGNSRCRPWTSGCPANSRGHRRAHRRRGTLYTWRSRRRAGRPRPVCPASGPFPAHSAP